MDRCKELGGDPPSGGLSLDLITNATDAHNLIEAGSENQYPNLEAKLEQIEEAIDGEFSVDGLSTLNGDLATLVANPS